MDSVHGNPEGLGCPIRKSTDQSLFAAPRDLSQRTTSFIASQRQGIHRMPLRHLIVLIFDAHPLACPCSERKSRTTFAEHGAGTYSRRPVRDGEGRDGFERPVTRHQSYSKDQLASHVVRWRRGHASAGRVPRVAPRSRPVLRQTEQLASSRCQTARPNPEVRNEFLVSSGRVRSIEARNDTCRKGSGGARRDRTDDLMLAKHALSQLSYGPWKMRLHMVGAPIKWWAWDDSNVRPHPYQGCALTT